MKTVYMVFLAIGIPIIASPYVAFSMAESRLGQKLKDRQVWILSIVVTCLVAWSLLWASSYLPPGHHSGYDPNDVIGVTPDDID